MVNVEIVSRTALSINFANKASVNWVVPNGAVHGRQLPKKDFSIKNSTQAFHSVVWEVSYTAEMHQANTVSRLTELLSIEI